MTPRNSLFRRMRAYIKVLNVPADVHPRIAKAAEEVGKPVALMTGVLWASYLAAYVSTSDEGLKDTFSLALTVSLWLFVSATIVQIIQASRSATSLENAIYWLCYIGLGLVSLGLLGYSVGFLSGVQDFKSSDRQAQYNRINKCLAHRAATIQYLNERFWEASSELAACVNVVNSDVSSIDLAFAEQRISDEQRKLLVKKARGRCNLDELSKRLSELKTVVQDECDPDRILKH